MKRKKKPEFKNKGYKDTVFRILYRNKKELLELYNALNGTNYTNEDDLIVTTLEGETLLKMKNDVSYIFNDELNLYEHQSTPCPNIPLRDLSYVASIYREQIDINKTYKSERISIPTPKFVVFYNGTIPMEDVKVYKLSDMFEKRTDAPELELIVKVLNINEGHNEELLKACKTLRGYSIFVAKVRQYIIDTKASHGKSNEEFCYLEEVDRKSIIAEAVSKAIDYCIENDILKEFFLEHREEAISVGVLEYSAERHMQAIGEENYEHGYKDGKSEGLEIGISKGIDIGIANTIVLLRKDGKDESSIIKLVGEQYNLTPDQVKKYL